MAANFSRRTELHLDVNNLPSPWGMVVGIPKGTAFVLKSEADLEAGKMELYCLEVEGDVVL